VPAELQRPWLLYLGCRDLGVDHTRQTAGRSLGAGSWRAALNQFDIMFPGRLDNA
jgi:putative transposase